MRALAQFTGSERSLGLLQDFENGYIKVQDSPLEVDHGVVVMAVGSRSGDSSFESYG